MQNLSMSVDGPGSGPATILGQRAARIPTGGKIRPGIKVLTQAAMKHEQACKLYRQGIEQGMSFDAIEAVIHKALPDLKNPLVPKNVAYFSAWASDFANPAIAAQLLEKYGEVRADGVRRLYRFPIVFPVDQWQSVMPHEMVCWGSSERRYWSQYSADGRTRQCMQHAGTAPGAGAQRVVRLFGGRKAVPRPDNGGLCEPELCPQYQNRECNLSGRFVFFVPGIASLDAFELPTNSFYAMSRAIEKFEAVAFLRGGRLSGFLDRKGSTFYLSKRLSEISRINDKGQAVRTEQWIIELDANIDVTSLLQLDDQRAIQADADNAAVLLGSQASMDGLVAGPYEAAHSSSHVFDEPGMITPVAEPEARPTTGAGRHPSQTARGERQARASSGDEGGAGGASACSSDGAGSGKASADAASAEAAVELEQLWDALRALGIEAQTYNAHADRQWGAGWKRNAGGRARARHEVAAHQDSPETLRSLVAAGAAAANGVGRA